MPLTHVEVASLRRMPPRAGNRLRLARVLAHASQMDLAFAGRVRQSRISAIERGEYALLPTALADKLAAFFGCDVEVLFPGHRVAALAPPKRSTRKAA